MAAGEPAPRTEPPIVRKQPPSVLQDHSISKPSPPMPHVVPLMKVMEEVLEEPVKRRDSSASSSSSSSSSGASCDNIAVATVTAVAVAVEEVSGEETPKEPDNLDEPAPTEPTEETSTVEDGHAEKSEEPVGDIADVEVVND